MSSVWTEKSPDFGEEQKTRIKNEREELKNRMEGLKKGMEKLEKEERQLKASLEREKDTEFDSKFQRLGDKAVVRIRNEREELRKRMEELKKKLEELDKEERQLKALIEHEKYPEWLELKKKRDKAVEEVERLEAEMKKLMKSIVIDTGLH